jgi:hypothetical protein
MAGDPVLWLRVALSSPSTDATGLMPRLGSPGSAQHDNGALSGRRVCRVVEGGCPLVR